MYGSSDGMSERRKQPSKLKHPEMGRKEAIQEILFEIFVLEGIREPLE